MFDLRLQVVIYPEREWSDWESRPQQRWLLFCGLNTYRLQSCVFVDNPLYESPRHLNQNFNSEFFNRFVSLPLSELPGMSSSVKNEGPDTRLCRKDAIVLYSVALDASFSCNSTQTILGRRHFGIRCIVFLSRNYRLIVAPRKFDVLKTNICPRSKL